MRIRWLPGALVMVGGLSLIISGAEALRRGALHYPNHWGGSVFAPLEPR